MIVVVVYDVASSRRREGVSGALGGCGARVQLSVFEVEVPDEVAFGQLRDRLAGLIDSDEDQVRMYRVGSTGQEPAVVLGNRVLEERRDYWIL